MSQINTNGIDQDYPIPGENNSSQGFRTNFAQIKNNLDIASDEITDLQKNVVVKSALEGVEIRNDMANTLISNAAVVNFRSTVFNLGSALSGRVVVDTTLADTFTGIVSDDVTLQFAKWAPVDTDRSINLRLVFDEANAVVSFPDEVVSFNDNFGTKLLENYKDSNGVATITRPATSDTVEIKLTTLDCGNTITATPINRPFKSTQVFEREPTPMGLPGDTNGTIAIGPEKRQVEITETTTLSVELANSDIDGNLLTIGETVSGEILPRMLLTGSGVTANTFVVENVSGDPNLWLLSEESTVSDITITGNVSVLLADDASSLAPEEPITFTGNTFGNVDVETTYYVDAVIDENTFTISEEPSGEIFAVGSDTGTMFANPAAYLYLCVDNFQGELDTKQVTDTDADGNFIRVSNTNNIDVNTPVFFTGDLTDTGLEANKIYYVKTAGAPNAEDLTLSLTRFNGVAGATVRVQTANLSGVTMTFINGGKDIWRRVNLNAW